MKSYSTALLIVCFALFSSVLHAQYWMEKGGSVTIDEAYDIGIDSAGNSYVTGYFTGVANFGPFSQTSSGASDIFIAKVNSSGVIEWLQKAGGSGNDRGLAIAVDEVGNSYITGYFNGTASFDVTNVVSAGSQDIFVAKYNTSGALQWVERMGGVESDQGNDIALDNQNNPVVTGDFRAVANFGATNLTGLSGSTDIFISKLNTAGAFQWTQQGASASNDRGLGISCDGNGNIYACGRFSQTITFDQVHSNSMLNVSYVVKFDALGQEDWFRIIGGGSSNIVNAIASEPNGNTYVCGDFTGSLTFFGSGSTTITSGFSNRIFLGKYSPSGTLQWAEAQGSESFISAEDMDVDDQGNPVILGVFECRLDEYSAIYGTGLFNSVGRRDIFISIFDTAGVWQLSRNFGGQSNDYGYGITLTDTSEIHIAGSFIGDLNFPTTNNFISSWTDVSCGVNGNYCGDPFYGTFQSFSSAGNSDAFFANCIDLSRSPYDYYARLGTGCVLDSIPGCIGSNCEDTFLFCGPPPEANHWQCPSIGQRFSYQWNGGFNIDTLQIIASPQQGDNTLFATSNDGCTQVFDTIFYHDEQQPLISDSKGINTMTSSPLEVRLCNPDSIVLTGFPFTSTSFGWSGPGIPGAIFDTSITVSTQGTFVFEYTDSLGCQNSNAINIITEDSLPPFLPRLLGPDTVVICEGETYEALLYDSFANPTANNLCFNQLPYAVGVTMTIAPSVFALFVCQSQLIITPEDSGLHVMEIRIVRANACGNDTHYVNAEVFVDLQPAPPPPAFTLGVVGSNYFCPGDSTLWEASGSIQYGWSGPGVSNYIADSLWINQEGSYTLVTEQSDTGANGCISTKDSSIFFCIREKAQPVLSVLTNLLCPNSFVELVGSVGIGSSPCSLPPQIDTFATWFGPSGQLPQNDLLSFATEPGDYFFVFNDGDSCDLVSNTVTINQYTIPSLTVIGNPVLCDGDSLIIEVIADASSVIQWQPPLSGFELQKTITAPGIYSAMITSCNITTIDTIEIFPSLLTSQIIGPSVLCLNDTIVLYGIDSLESYTWLPGGQTSDSILVDAPDTFQLTVTDSNGCVSVSQPFEVVQNQVPTTLTLNGPPNFCAYDSVELVGNSNMASYDWQPSGDSTQSIWVTLPGDYTLSTIDADGCPGFAGPIALDTLSSHAAIDIEGELEFCEGGVATLTTTRTAGIVSYQWSPIMASSRFIIVSTSGNYVLQTIDTAGCIATSRPIRIIMQPDNVAIPVVQDTAICEGSSIILRPRNGASGELNWMVGQDSSTVVQADQFVTEPLFESTTFYTWRKLDLCTSPSAGINVEILDCDAVVVPNVFTPNGDGYNDIFRTSLDGNKCYHCYIYNRWGQLLYEMHEFNPGWDGSIQDSGNQAIDGVYFYLIEYCRYDDEIIEHRGTITLIRE